jgi:hypothetical protein
MDGNMWGVVQNAGQVAKFTTDGTVLGCYPDVPAGSPWGGEAGKSFLSSPYTYSDLTGSTFQLVTSKIGVWRGIVDAGLTVKWLGLHVEAEIPAQTDVCTRVRVAAVQADLEKAKWSEEHCTEFPWAFAIGTLGDSQFMEVELHLSSEDPAKSPVVTGLSVAAQAL